MPSRHRRSSFARSRAPRRKLVWATTNQVLNFTAVGNVTNLDLLAPLKVAGSSVLGATIMRTHVHLAVISTVAAGNDFVWGLVVAPASEGVNNTPDTARIIDVGSEPELDWMYESHEIAAPTYSHEASNNHIILDNRSKRKVEELGQSYFLCIGVNSGGATMSFQVFVRTLVALP